MTRNDLKTIRRPRSSDDFAVLLHTVWDEAYIAGYDAGAKKLCDTQNAERARAATNLLQQAGQMMECITRAVTAVTIGK